MLAGHCRAESAGVEVKAEPFVADFYCVKSSIPKPGILLLGGSEGGRPNGRLPDFLASNGWAVLAVAYFRDKGLPPSLQMIPLEYFDAPLAWMNHNANIRPGGVLVMGGSKGAELALLLASKRPAIRAVIAVAPSSVVWVGMQDSGWPADSLSSWTFHGKPVPFLPLDYCRRFDTHDPLAAVKLLKAALDQKELVKKTSIRVEKINGPILLLSGKADEIWPSAQMADALCERLRTKHFRFKYENVQYADAGHTLHEHGNFGGTPEGNAKAGSDAKLRILAFLRAAAGQIGAPH
jgi:dienelactone hydrolase